MTRDPATPTGAIGEALRAGIDIGLLEDNLRLTYEQRALQHQDALDLALALERAGRDLHERPATPAATAR
ncbi:hypothetical protein CSC71_08840 [Pseudoxanthomonas sangjuensis]|uniref:hypothetical protein n=1 Tax=Pseudoxanthomonas sangjuensis TaxID=1503750 RepID=UPI0013917226|nr:hypothetical protein [Pseudoxanthomonas sangjuensis]KAF1713244.1 hypothetical protein CSC71_08840 [Pseudoxanthomonas sangjuensis]